MDWGFIAKYIPLYREAALLTVRIGFAGIAAAALIGLICRTIDYYKVVWRTLISTCAIYMLIAKQKMVHIAQCEKFYEQSYYTPSEEGFLILFITDGHCLLTSSINTFIRPPQTIPSSSATSLLISTVTHRLFPVPIICRASILTTFSLHPPPIVPTD